MDVLSVRNFAMLAFPSPARHTILYNLLRQVWYVQHRLFSIQNCHRQMCQQAQGGSRLLDTSATVLGDYTIAFSRGNALVVEIGRQKQLFDANLKPLSEAYSSMKFLKSDLILAKIKKEYTLLDDQGTVLYVGPEPPEDILLHSFLVFKTGGSYKVKDLSDKVIADRCTSAEGKGNYLLIRQNGTTNIFDLRGNLLIDEVTGHILVDTLANGLAIVEKNKVTEIGRA